MFTEGCTDGLLNRPCARTFPYPSEDSNLTLKDLEIFALRNRNAINGVERFGSSGRIRTYNPSVNSRMLYH
jgi:hypothetical protein